LFDRKHILGENPRVPIEVQLTGAIMNHESAVMKAREIANGVLAPSAAQNDKAGRFSDEAIQSLGDAGLLGLMLPVDVGGADLGPRTFAAVTATLAEADASVAMVYIMHILGTTAVAAARPSAAQLGNTALLRTVRPNDRVKVL
jgi:alkylation response protein AidB-like acyl-CoA dehydrogenase